MDKQETRVTVADAKAAALRLINSHFRNDDQARMHIPAREEDDDLLLMRFLNQQEVGESSSKGHAELPANNITGPVLALPRDEQLNVVATLIALVTREGTKDWSSDWFRSQAENSAELAELPAFPIEKLKAWLRDDGKPWIHERHIVCADVLAQIEKIEAEVKEGKWEPKVD